MQQQSQYERHFDEKDLQQALFESELEEENKRMQNAIDEITAEKCVHEAKIKLLREELVALSSAEINDADYSSRFFDDFTVTQILGEGGYGCVFEAENRLDCATYAVKRVAVDAGKITRDKALMEVRAMANLDHEGIVRYNNTWIEEPPEGWQFDADLKMLKNMGTPNRRLKMHYKDDCAFIYIHMQRCNHSLASWLKDNTTDASRPIPLMKSWFKQMVSAVAYIHEKNLIHRDLKPSNVLFDEDGRLKLCDLGIATQRSVEDGTETAITRTNIGTLIYMSPEQIPFVSRSRYSSQTDVFALGLILSELCIAMTVTERKKIFDEYRLGRQSNRIEDAKTADFVRKLTQMDPKNRPACREMLDHLYLA